MDDPDLAAEDAPEQTESLQEPGAEADGDVAGEQMLLRRTACSVDQLCTTEESSVTAVPEQTAFARAVLQARQPKRAFNLRKLCSLLWQLGRIGALSCG